MQSTEPKLTTDVALGVIYDNGKVLVGRRAEHQVQGGYLEFPGGKLEQGESFHQALVREIYEETQIKVLNAQPLIQFEWNDPQQRLHFCVFKVDKWMHPSAYHQNAWQWVSLGDLCIDSFPPANKCIINALRLPAYYLVTPLELGNVEDFVSHFSRCLDNGVRLCVFRNYEMDDTSYLDVLSHLLAQAKRSHSDVLIHNRIALIDKMQVAGIHFSATALAQYTKRPIPSDLWLVASCHNKAELEQALRVDADFVTLGSVCDTPSHPQRVPIGWQAFERLVEKLPIPVYAIGGMAKDQLEHSRMCGAQGIACTRALWN